MVCMQHGEVRRERAVELCGGLGDLHIVIRVVEVEQHPSRGVEVRAVLREARGSHAEHWHFHRLNLRLVLTQPRLPRLDGNVADGALDVHLVEPLQRALA